MNLHALKIKWSKTYKLLTLRSATSNPNHWSLDCAADKMYYRSVEKYPSSALKKHRTEEKWGYMYPSKRIGFSFVPFLSHVVICFKLLYQSCKRTISFLQSAAHQLFGKVTSQIELSSTIVTKQQFSLFLFGCTFNEVYILHNFSIWSVVFSFSYPQTFKNKTYLTHHSQNLGVAGPKLAIF